MLNLVCKLNEWIWVDDDYFMIYNFTNYDVWVLVGAWGIRTNMVDKPELYNIGMYLYLGPVIFHNVNWAPLDFHSKRGCGEKCLFQFCQFVFKGARMFESSECKIGGQIM